MHLKHLSLLSGDGEITVPGGAEELAETVTRDGNEQPLIFCPRKKD